MKPFKSIAIVLLALAVFCLACSAQTQTLRTARGAAIVADEFAILHESVVDSKIDACRSRSLPTEAERAACLGWIYDSLDDMEAAYVVLLTVSQEIWLANVCSLPPEKRPTDAADVMAARGLQCGVGPTNWELLRGRLLKAAADLLPYLKRLRAESKN